MFLLIVVAFNGILRFFFAFPWLSIVNKLGHGKGYAWKFLFLKSSTGMRSNHARVLSRALYLQK